MTQKNAVIYVDYENIFETLDHYGADPLEINFFPIVLDRLKTVHRFNPINCNVYFNFTKFDCQHQNVLQRLGLTLCPSMYRGKNSSDLLLTVDSMTTLYENPTIEAFVIISSDRDMAPLIAKVRGKGKLTFLMTEKRVMNRTLINEADIHEFVEDVFDLKAEMLVSPQDRALLTNICHENITLETMAQAKQVSVLLYKSNLWRVSQEENDPVTLEGYITQLSKRVHRDIDKLRQDFEVANCLGYVTIYRDEKKDCLCLKRGKSYETVLTGEKQRKECHG
jgi:hypothetical protein